MGRDAQPTAMVDFLQACADRVVLRAVSPVDQLSAFHAQCQPMTAEGRDLQAQDDEQIGTGVLIPFAVGRRRVVFRRGNEIESCCPCLGRHLLRRQLAV